MGGDASGGLWDAASAPPHPQRMLASATQTHASAAHAEEEWVQMRAGGFGRLRRGTLSLEAVEQQILAAAGRLLPL